ncbi:DUF3488 and transglutaminase-like domain-containing protein [Dasania sp. GY-MA-18]|uniref:DUF3488 and transglutaminase-like domain-containing protein n=1 Tax=Dasania phycosphaerae TaxID=2950436 RepID=A0A9J6RHL1_9GAMM|nr:MULTISPECIES: DUF3488 and transglutaminase-like domain-containing protein [Dasania]MCR8921730.1 DUF3488 and transglutaminase-like domain-containing protein [Dasania sp. GY-MA-18]MCZ0864158.1 DUF3488 and transglutaminase-like domain-containing protein [Dasania phycosphaerae]MCZ0867886.1 DUF3488 and transglutaminase-like domain-containing protein [Dasania phycosphaerae]
MATDWQLPRPAMIWMLAAQLLVVLGHVGRLPLWLLCAYGGCVLWRYQIYSGAWSAPKTLVKAGIILAVFAGIYASYRSLLGLEPMVSLLMAGFAFKLLESYSQRDCMRFIFIGYFTLATVFLFNQGLLTSLYVLVTLLLLSAALVSLQFPPHKAQAWLPLKKISIIFAQALPLTLLLFFLFPRFEPFWQIKLPSHQAKTGVGDVLSPGDISQLSKDDSLAFRANFVGERPPRSELYWRGVVLSYFDGRAWHQGTFQKKFHGSNTIELVNNNEPAKSYQYSIIQEPNYRPWLYTLAVASSKTPKVLATSDYRLQYREDIVERIAYQVETNSQAIMASTLSTVQRHKETLLNGDNNPRARALAARLYQQSASDQAYIQAVLNYFAQQNFFYTLMPPLLGENNIDEFLLDSRRGFCGHYASSFAFLIRAAGIPARVIGGYQGGEYNPLTGSVLVHQFDAHAWAEVWLPGKGWQRFDPTLQVAPDRIENSVQDLPATQADYLSQSGLSVMRFKHIAFFNKLRLELDAMEYRWASWVLQYKGERQFAFIEKWLGAITFTRIAFLLLLVSLPVVLWLLWSILQNRSAQTLKPQDADYQKLCQLMGRYDLHRQPNEGPIAFAQRVEQAANGPSAAIKQKFLAATRLYVALAYEPQGGESAALLAKQLRAELGVLKGMIHSHF